MPTTDNEEAGKLFVGGLSWETTKEDLQTYFNKFGEVVDSVVMMNSETGRSRGFGFVTFSDPSCVSIVIQNKPHEMHGRTIDAKECTPRGMQKNNKKGPNQGKMFLGGLPPDITESDIRTAMSEYGVVTQISIMRDQETKKCRGFGFLSFDSEDSTDRACADRFVNINGKQVECKRAESRENPRRNQQQFAGGAQNGGSYGSGPQGNWGQPAQSFGMPGGNAYGNYQPYAAPAAAPYGQSAIPFNSAAQYQQPQQWNYGGMGYGYAPVAAPAAGNWNAATAAAPVAGYSQPPGMGVEANADGANDVYQQSNSSYGPAKAYGGGAGGYSKQSGGGGGGGGKAQSYHPYRH